MKNWLISKVNTSLEAKYRKKRTRLNTSYDSSASIGFLIYDPDGKEQTALNEIVEGLKKEGKKVEVLIFLQKIRVTHYKFDFDFFTFKDVSALGKFKPTFIRKFIEQKFDYLYVLSKTHLPVFDRILMKSHAKCRVGTWQSGNEAHYELMVSVPESYNLEKSTGFMLQYTKMLRTNG